MTNESQAGDRSREIGDLFARLRQRDRRALSRLITLVENGTGVTETRADLSPHDPARTFIVTLTGAPGAGKSSLTASLIKHLRSLGKSVAVLASDPASPFSGGALLGDRVRIDYDPNDAGVYVRSFSSRGAQGGVSESTPDVLRLVEAFGFDVILLETVGSGQDQLAARDMCDVLALVLTPAGGDDIQWEKAGQMEAADVVILNKADLPGADFAMAGLRAIFELSPQLAPPLVKTIATTDTGIAEAWQAIAERGEAGSSPRQFAGRRRLLSVAQRELRRWFERVPSDDPRLLALLADFESGKVGEEIAAKRLVKLVTDA